jgi:hypothetical protein
MYYLELLRASEGTLSRWSWMHLQSLHQPALRVVGYGPFSLCVIHKEGLCPSSVDINTLMMMTYRIICFWLYLPIFYYSEMRNTTDVTSGKPIAV